LAAFADCSSWRSEHVVLEILAEVPFGRRGRYALERLRDLDLEKLLELPPPGFDRFLARHEQRRLDLGRR
jgi:hypothetical protein